MLLACFLSSTRVIKFYFRQYMSLLKFLFIHYQSHRRILQQYCDSLLYTTLYCQDILYGTLYGIFSLKKVAQRYHMNNPCSILCFISENCISWQWQLGMYISQGQLNTGAIDISQQGSGDSAVVWRPAADRHGWTDFCLASPGIVCPPYVFWQGFKCSKKVTVKCHMQRLLIICCNEWEK
jgi:hypothetical protein